MAEVPQEDTVEEVERERVAAHELSWALRAVVRASADVDRELAHRLGLRPLDYAAMNHALSSAQPLGPAELGARLGISSGSATELVDRLERAGHLRRQPHPGDRRRIGLQPTESSVAHVVDTLSPLLGDLDGLAEVFTPAEQDAISRYLRAAEERLHRFARGNERRPQRPTSEHGRGGSRGRS